MALVIEDGTGLASAQSFVSIAEIDAWASARGLVWSGADSVKEPFAVRAADYIRNGFRFKRWRGTPMSVLQRLPYGRRDVVTQDGLSLPDGIVPWQVKDAQCALSVLAKAGLDLQPSLKNGGLPVISKTLGPISTTWASPNSSNSNPLAAETLLTEVIGYLTPLLLVSDDRAEVVFVEGAVPDGYKGDSYVNTEM